MGTDYVDFSSAGQQSNRESGERQDIRVISVEQRGLEQNKLIANQNREDLMMNGVCAIDLLGSPGAGKRTLLAETLNRLQSEIRCAVIQGDQHSEIDPKVISQTGVPIVQVNNQPGCYLDAAQFRLAMKALPLGRVELLLIENVSSLVCPPNYSLGEQDKVVFMSVTDGEEKPIQYPLAFQQASLLVLTKTDLLPHLRFDLEQCKQYVRQVNPRLDIIETSVFSGEGIENWLEWLRFKVRGW